MTRKIEQIDEDLSSLRVLVDRIVGCFASPDWMEIKRVEFKRGDRIVLRHPGRLSDRAYDRLCKNCAAIVPEVEVLLLEEGLDLAVLSPDRRF